jgi:hypothetical protein
VAFPRSPERKNKGGCQEIAAVFPEINQFLELVFQHKAKPDRMFETILSKNAKESLAALGKSGLLKSAYLAGGTALALQIGHRHSYDFDFFAAKEFNERIFLQKITKIIPDFRLERKDWRTVLGYIGNARFSYFFYQYPLLFKTKKILGVNLADPRDIAAMKVAALSDRGTKRDFVDLFFIFSEEEILTLADALEIYDRKFRTLRQNKIHLIKSLSYFADADQEKMPRMLKSVSWKKVKDYFISEQKKMAKELLER